MQVGTDGPKRVEREREISQTLYYLLDDEREKDLITYSFVINLLPIDIFFPLFLYFLFFSVCFVQMAGSSTIYFLFFFVCFFCHSHLKSKIEYIREEKREKISELISFWVSLILT